MSLDVAASVQARLLNEARKSGDVPHDSAVAAGP